MVKLTGGGIQSRNVSNVYEPKIEPKPRAMSPAGVAQQGMATAFKKEPLEKGPGFRGGPMGATGVPGKYNAATSGPGSLRTTYPSGSQTQYGSPAPNAVNRAPDPPATTPGRDILSSYGPERGR
jgi:hypothetical protein